MECPFCQIHEERTRMIEDGERVFVVLSNPRLMSGHLLVVPKKHIERISELSKGEKDELFDKIIKYQELILSKFASGCDVRINYRPFIKEGRLKVSHFHIHLLPREFNDELYEKSMIYEAEIFKDLTSKEIEEVISRFNLNK